MRLITITVLFLLSWQYDKVISSSLCLNLMSWLKWSLCKFCEFFLFFNFILDFRDGKKTRFVKHLTIMVLIVFRVTTLWSCKISCHSYGWHYKRRWGFVRSVLPYLSSMTGGSNLPSTAVVNKTLAKNYQYHGLTNRESLHSLFNNYLSKVCHI